MDLFQYAQHYHDRGYSIIPLRLFLKSDGKVAKIPPKGLNWKKFQTERVTKSHLLTKWAGYFKDGPGHGIGIVTGQLSNLLVVDIDDLAAEEIVRKHMPLGFETLTVKTGSGGLHLYFKWKEGLKNTAGLGDTGLDIRTDGGYAAAPPTKFPIDHPGQYIFQNKAEIAEIPDTLFFHLKKLISRYSAGKKQPERNSNGRSTWFLDALNGTSEGQRVTLMMRIIGKLRRMRVSKEVALAIVLGWNMQNTPPEDEREVKNQFNSAWKNIIQHENNQILEAMNEEFSIVTTGNKIRVLQCDKWDKLHMFPKGEFRDKLYNQSIIVNDREVKIADLWLNWKARRTYERIVFSPGDNDNDSYNLWKGFAYIPKKGNWSNYQKHVEDIIAPGNADWIFKWMARIIQQPGGERPGTSIVLRGGQGAGKGIFANNFGKLLGSHYTIINNIEHLTGRFNEDIATSLLLHVDEATWGGDRTTAGQIKNLITEPQRRMEIKGGDILHVDNHLNIIISSNNKWIVPSGPMERRFFVLDVLEDRMQDHEYFKAIVNQLNAGGYEAMLYDLQNLKFNLDDLRETPSTLATRDQIIRGLDLPERFWYTRLFEGKLVDSHDFWKNKVVKTKLYDQYVHFCQTNNFSTRIEIPALFSKAIFNCCPGAKTIQGRQNKNRFWCFVFPSLEKCRADFDKFIQRDITMDWPEIIEPENMAEREKERHVDYPGSYMRLSDPY